MKFSSNFADKVDVLDLNRLIRIMEAEDRGYGELEEMETHKREFLVKGKTLELEVLLQRQESQISGLRRLEAQRQNFMQFWHKAKGSKLAPTLGEIVERAPEEKGKVIQELKLKLTKRVESLGYNLRGNETLIKQSLEHVERLTGILTGSHTPLSYEQGGRCSMLGRRQIMNRRV